MSQCVACGAELEPPVRTSHTVYVKSLYRIAGQNYCRHHIIRAAVAAGVITEVKPGAGPAATMNRGVPPWNMTGPSRGELMYAITLHQPWATLIALGVKTVETRSWPTPERMFGQTIAVHAGKRVVRRPGDRIERELGGRLGEDWRRIIPTGAVVATATLAGMARVEHVDLTSSHAVHDGRTEIGCAAGRGRTHVDPWGDFSAGRWLWFLDDVEALPEPIPAVGHQSFWRWVENGDIS